MGWSLKGFKPESALLSSAILDFVEYRLHKILRPAAKTGTRVICFTEHVDFNSAEKNLSIVKSKLMAFYANSDITELAARIDSVRQ